MILIEPFFAQYTSHIQLGGGKIVTVPLELKDGRFELNFEVLKSVLNEKSRMIILNTPHNPTGKVFTKEELLKITEILDPYPNCYVLSDEVYDFLTFQG